MAMLLTTREAFERVEKYLKENQYLYTAEKVNNGFLVKIN